MLEHTLVKDMDRFFVRKGREMMSWLSKLSEEIERNPLNSLPLLVFVGMVVTFFLSLFLSKNREWVFWFGSIFGIGIAIYTFCFSMLWAGSGNLFSGMKLFFISGWEAPLIKIFLFFLPPTGWLNLVGGSILILGKPRSMGFVCLSSIALVALGLISTMAIIIGIIVDPSGL